MTVSNVQWESGEIVDIIKPFEIFNEIEFSSYRRHVFDINNEIKRRNYRVALHCAGYRRITHDWFHTTELSLHPNGNAKVEHVANIAVFSSNIISHLVE